MDFTSIGTLLILICLIILALAVALKLLNTADKQFTTRKINSPPAPMDEDRFLTSFLKPVYDDGLAEMETAADALRDGLDFYGRRAFVNAGEQFIDAGRSIDAATNKFNELLALVEDPSEEYAKKARHRLIDCKRFEELALDMEKACDAMLARKTFEARVLEEKVRDSKKFVEEWRSSEEKEGTEATVDTVATMDTTDSPDTTDTTDIK
jgi:hypothetical protein